MRCIYLSSLLFVELMSVAIAQPRAGIKPLEQMDMPDAAAARGRVYLSINLFVPASKKDQALKAQEQVRRMIYDTAGHECSVLLDVIASDCKLQSINIATQRADEPEGFNVNGNIGFVIVLRRLSP